MLEGLFKFDATPKTLGVSGAGVDVISTNVFDAGEDKRLFGGFTQKPPVLAVHYTITAGTGALGFRARFVASDAASLDNDVEIIADTGIHLLDADNTALAIGDRLTFFLTLRAQRLSKRYYGVFYTQSTADQNGTVTSFITEAPQTNMPYTKQAVPA